ncbi:MAG: hypothetical protein KDD62_10880 [Bdellovibrionales bacterium]|nr:hypothetical protein [Bdellovibrionales bacterium]
MYTDMPESNSSCALVLMDGRSGGLIGSTIIHGELLIDTYNDAFYFKLNDEDGVPMPHQWKQSLMKTPREKSALLRGSKYYISVSKVDALKYLDTFDVSVQ